MAATCACGRQALVQADFSTSMGGQDRTVLCRRCAVSWATDEPLFRWLGFTVLRRSGSPPIHEWRPSVAELEGRVAIRMLEVSEAVACCDQLLAVARRAKATWGYDEAFLDRFVAEQMGPFDAPGSTVVVAEVDGALAGFAMVVDRGDVAWLEDLWVDPAYQRSGIGSALIAAASDLARSWGSTAVELESDPNAEPFYLAQGAVRVGVRPSTLRPGVELPRMRLDLT